MDKEFVASLSGFGTGKQKVLDTGGRIDKFQKRFGGFKK